MTLKWPLPWQDHQHIAGVKTVVSNLQRRDADKFISHALLQILCALVSSDDNKQRWLQSSGIVKLLQRLTLDAQIDIKVCFAYLKAALLSDSRPLSLKLSIESS